MNRRTIVLVAALAAVAIVGVVYAVPLVRRSIATYRHVQIAAQHEPEARALWARTFGDPDAALAAYPDREASETAVRTAELARAIGLDLASSATARVVPAADPLQPVWKAVTEYDHAELTKPGGPVSAPAAAVRAHLDANRAGIQSLVEFLVGAREIAWKSDVASKGLSAYVPNLLAELNLQRLFVAECLSRVERGALDDVDRILEASWILNAGLRDRPDLISQLVAASVFRMQVGLARRIPIASEVWARRCRDHDYRASLLRAMEIESVVGVRSLPAGASAFDRASRADYLDIKREVLGRLRNAPVSDGPLPLDTWSEEEPLTAGTVVATIALPNLASTVRRVDRLIVDAELTELVLQARLLRDRLGRWPEALAGAGRSAIPDATWIYSVDGSGMMTIRLSRDLRWQDGQGLVLPVRFESS
jgi:hypothetical protein